MKWRPLFGNMTHNLLFGHTSKILYTLTTNIDVTETWNKRVFAKLSLTCMYCIFQNHFSVEILFGCFFLTSTMLHLKSVQNSSFHSCEMEHYEWAQNLTITQQNKGRILRFHTIRACTKKPRKHSITQGKNSRFRQILITKLPNISLMTKCIIFSEKLKN